MTELLKKQNIIIEQFKKRYESYDIRFLVDDFGDKKC